MSEAVQPSQPGFFYRAKKAMFQTIVKITHALVGEKITHRSKFAKAIHNAVFSFFRFFDPARRAQARFEKENPDAPWLAVESIARIEDILQPDFRYLEWGTGRSTFWFAERVGHVVAIEHHKGWYEDTMQQIDAYPMKEKIEYVLQEGDAAGPDVDDLPYVRHIDSYPDASFDMIMVDGMARNACIRAALPKLKPSGYLVVDNAERLDLKESLEQVPAEHWEKYDNGIWETHIFHGFAA